MSTIEKTVPPLAAGDRLTWEEFERCWEAAPEIKFAELIGGRVYMPPPLSYRHGRRDALGIVWLGRYEAGTRGVEVVANATCRMLKDAPQPDAHLRIRHDFGGRSRVRGKYLVGAPELTLEVCLSSAAYDLHEKKDLYEAAGVDEYLAVLLHEEEVRWHRLEGGKYRLLAPADGILRSVVFPGLWLNAAALLKGDTPALLKTLDAGLTSAEHARFAGELARRRN